MKWVIIIETWYKPSDDKGILAWLGEHNLATLVLVLLLAGADSA